MQRIRNFYGIDVLYKITFYLLTYFILTVKVYGG